MGVKGWLVVGFAAVVGIGSCVAGSITGIKKGEGQEDKSYLKRAGQDTAKHAGEFTSGFGEEAIGAVDDTRLGHEILETGKAAKNALEEPAIDVLQGMQNFFNNFGKNKTAVWSREPIKVDSRKGGKTLRDACDVNKDSDWGDKRCGWYFNGGSGDVKYDDAPVHD